MIFEEEKIGHMSCTRAQKIPKIHNKKPKNQQTNVLFNIFKGVTLFYLKAKN